MLTKILSYVILTMDSAKTVQPTAMGVLKVDWSAKAFNEKGEITKLASLIPIRALKPADSNEFEYINQIFDEDYWETAKIPRTQVTTTNDRYSNIRPYSHNVVRLEDKPNSAEVENYINADYIFHIYDKSITAPAFIATQGPTPETYNHFWRMVWQENVKSVVMLCGLAEDGFLMCDVYWPEKGEILYDYLKVTITGFKKISDFYWIRTFEVYNTQTKETRKVTHYHAVGWPDRKVPANKHTNSFEELLNIIVHEKDASPQPVVVHCSAGVGRTGTFISLYFMNWMLRWYKANGQLDSAGLSVWGTVRALREQRMMSVQSTEQYEYLYSFMAMVIKKALGK